jgi:hypothetical protein
MFEAFSNNELYKRLCLYVRFAVISTLSNMHPLGMDRNKLLLVAWNTW